MTTERRSVPADARTASASARFSGERLGDPGALVRRHDPDRFLLCVLLPPALRDAAFTLVAFNHELARATEIGGRRDRDEATGGFASAIRLQWWREIVTGERRASHEVATPLAVLLGDGRVASSTLLDMIDAREDELGGFADEEAWRRSLARGPGGLARALGALAGLDAPALDRVAQAGISYGVGATIRHLPALLGSGRRPLPDPLLASVDRDASIRALAERERDALRARPRLPIPRPGRAAALHAVLARRDLDRAARGSPTTTAAGMARTAGRRPVGDMLAVVAAWTTGRF